VRHFTVAEFDCQETGNNRMEKDFLRLLDGLRDNCGFPFKITSGYRDPTHSIEAAKAIPGRHAQGIAADIQILDSKSRYKIIKEAMKLGFTGIGVADTFVHLDTRGTPPVMWTY
jgi:zinc D-Ala-D-Ala carboxypeptidase